MPEADDPRRIRLSLPWDARGGLEARWRAGPEPDESMNSRVSWSAEGIDPSVRERAEAAARRAGMSLSDWLSSTIGDATPPDFRASPAPSRETREVADIHQRLDSITRHIEHITGPARRHDAPQAGRDEPGVARQLNDAISRLDARLSQITNPAVKQVELQESQRNAEMVDRAAAQVYRPSPPLSAASFDLAIAEIAARQSELDDAAPRPAPPRNALPTAAVAPPATPGPDFSSLERHLFKITSQIEALQRPDGIEQSIAAFRGELAEIRHAITEAMPRQAIESIEHEIRSLSRRIDDTRHSGIDGKALAGIEDALGEIRQVLRSLTPAEQLAGYDDAIRNLGTKLDLILRANDDPSTIQQLEGAIAALRAIVSNVASNDALVRLSDDLRTLSSKVDQLTRFDGNGDSFAKNDNPSAFAHLEQRVTYLLDRLEASTDPRAGNLGRVEDGLQDILRHLETQQATFAALAKNNHGAAGPADSDLFDIVKRELSDIRSSQLNTNRHTQDALEAVHGTLGLVVDRLATIEGDLRGVRSPAGRPSDTPPARQAAPSQAAPRAAMPPQSRPELPNPAAAQQPFVAAPRDFQAAPAAPKAISDILGPPAQPPRAVIASDLPPDHPLEPGTRPSGRVASPAERIAASESAISGIVAGARGPASTSSFIAAARRAAQAAAALPAADNPGRGPLGNVGDKEPSTVTSKIRSLLVGASVVVIVLGTFKMAMTLLDVGGPPLLPFMETSGEPPAPLQPAAEDAAKPAPPDAVVAPSVIQPPPVDRRSLNGAAPNPADSSASLAIPQLPAAPSSPAASRSDVTGSIPPVQPALPSRKLATVQVPPTERIPDAIGGPVLRAAALKGDATAAYEIAVRFSEGKGVVTNFAEAAKWFDRAAQAGVVPAIFRLGTFYEKGLSVTKDVDTAWRYYVQAAERGNAKAMHNLAVLDADGGGKGANYPSAAQWFRKAAERGIADSQFNLGILYARGIGVEQNLPEAFKWFSLAAAQGDADAGGKRDDVAKRLDPQSLAAAKLAIQTFTPERQPDDAVNVPAPAGGWDSAPAQANSARPAAKPAPIKRASR
jgi:localization factor PodJL